MCVIQIGATVTFDTLRTLCIYFGILLGIACKMCDLQHCRGAVVISIQQLVQGRFVKREMKRFNGGKMKKEKPMFFCRKCKRTGIEI